MRRGLTALVVALVALVGGVGAATEPVDNGSPRIEEDDPRWDCKTMGNRICGPGH